MNFRRCAFLFSRTVLPAAAAVKLSSPFVPLGHGQAEKHEPLGDTLAKPSSDEPTKSGLGPPVATPAEKQFRTASSFPIPKDWTGEVSQINNDYRKALISEPEALWLKIDFRKEPERYAAAVKKYCWEGNREVDWVAEKNETKKWWHAPWLHHSRNGREPLRGLTFERPTPPLEFAKAQTHALQNWAIGFYNEAAMGSIASYWNSVG